MSIEGDLTPAPQPDSGQPVPPAAPAAAAAPQSWLLRHRRLLIPAGAVLALGSVSAAAVLLLVKPNSTVEKMVPATQDVIVVANVDPSVSQKVNLLRAVHSFPDTKTDAAIDAKLDQAFKDSGFTFTGDIKPWLGPQVAVSAKLNLTSTKDIPAAVYIASRDDTKAKAMLAKLRAGKYGTNATTGAQIHEIIDTDQGRASRLVDSSDFKATLADLPSDRLGYLYVNGRSLVANVKKEMATTPAMALALKNINDVNALQGIGATLSANGDGMLADLLVKLDQSKLSPATREALAHPGRADTIVSWVPKSSDAFLAITSLNKTIQSLLDQSGNEASVKAGTDAIGLTGPGGVLPHLTGDAGLEVGFASNGIPAGAIVLGTNDAKSMNAFFAKLLVLADGAIGSSLLGAGSSFGSPSPPVAPASHTTTTNYRGVVITSWTSPALGGLGAGALSPSYAVLDGMGILASTPAEVKAIIDTHKDAASIASDTTYKSASTASLASPSGIIYLDIAKLVDAIRKSPLGSQAGLGSGSTLSATVGPVKAVILTAASQADRATERFFVIVR